MLSNVSDVNARPRQDPKNASLPWLGWPKLGLGRRGGEKGRQQGKGEEEEDEHNGENTYKTPKPAVDPAPFCADLKQHLLGMGVGQGEEEGLMDTLREVLPVDNSGHSKVRAITVGFSRACLLYVGVGVRARCACVSINVCICICMKFKTQDGGWARYGDVSRSAAHLNAVRRQRVDHDQLYKAVHLKSFKSGVDAKWAGTLVCKGVSDILSYVSLELGLDTVM
jgi:hypothetical protein